MISFNANCPPDDETTQSLAAQLAALDALLQPEFDEDCPADEGFDDAWTAEEPLPVSAFRPPVLAPDELALPDSMGERIELHLAEIGLSDRTLNTLEEAGLHLVGELLNRRPDQLLAIPKFGPATLDEVYRALARLGFYRTCLSPSS
jgi:DNA-directed RNA polymerase subunit alpha